MRIYAIIISWIAASATMLWIAASATMLWIAASATMLWIAASATMLWIAASATMLLLITACAPSDAQIAAALEQTRAAQPSPTIAPTIAPTHNPCPDGGVESTIQKLDDLTDRWQDVLGVAWTRNSDQISPLVRELQDLENEALGLEVPDCMAEIHGKLLDSMGDYIHAVLKFMEEKLGETHIFLKRADAKFADYERALRVFRACAPDC